MRLSSSCATAKEASKKRRTWALIRRLLLLPLSFALLHVPGSIRRTAKLTKFVATVCFSFCTLRRLVVFLFMRLCMARALLQILLMPLSHVTEDDRNFSFSHLLLLNVTVVNGATAQQCKQYRASVIHLRARCVTHATDTT